MSCVLLKLLCFKVVCICQAATLLGSHMKQSYVQNTHAALCPRPKSATPLASPHPPRGAFWNPAPALPDCKCLDKLDLIGASLSLQEPVVVP